MKEEGRNFRPAAKKNLPSAFFLLPLLGFLLPLAALAANAPALSKDDSDFFENNIRPLLVNNCYKCHSRESTKLRGGLSLEFRETILAGGETGPALVPGHPEQSLLIKAVSYTDPDLQMPPKDRKLSDDQIALLSEWIRRGAPDPRTVHSLANPHDWNKPGSEHWAFQPVKKPALPQVTNSAWCATPVDNFILAKLEAQGMQPAPAADKQTLLRRATFDLTGLPPTPQEMDDFLADSSPDAYAKVVDRLLASPRYGERWGRIWLDVARYSDTKGEVRRAQESPLSPFAWTYRDYVIRAFNEDKPFNEFLVEQIAADKLDLNNRSNLAAMGFLTVGDHFNGMVNDMLNDRIDVVCKGTMALTVSCARCHDHKFDPIPQQDYYSLRGIFASSVEPAEEPLISPVEFTPQYDDFVQQYNTLETELAALKAIRPRDLAKEQRRRMVELQQKIALLEIQHPGSPPRAMVLVDSPKPSDSHLLIRGEAGHLGPIVPRRFLEVLSGAYRPPFTNGSGRLQLAAAIVSPGNPLTARVIVNRVWLHHFGAGLVTTPDDFGMQSEPPSHPELLDYLAATFMEQGWSLKQLHRAILLSSTYCQSCENPRDYADADPHNRLLWHANIQRLDFEEVRDSILAIGGSLDLTMGGRPVRLNVLPYSTRRTVYGFVDRQNLPEIFTQFDFANPDAETGRRYETIVPQQALFLMNSPMVIEQARRLTSRNEFDQFDSDDDRIRYLYQRIYQREPTAEELALGKDYIQNSPPPEPMQVTNPPPANSLAQAGPPGPPGDQKPRKKAPPSFSAVPRGARRPLDSWTKYAHALMQANEAMFVD
jgi:cytochrome c553